MIATITTRLLEHHINPASTIEYEVNGELHVYSLEEIATAYMEASEASQQIFIEAFETALKQGKQGIQSYFEKMGQLLLMSTLSQRFEV